MDKRIEKSQQSVIALRNMLRAVIDNPDIYVHQDSVIKALKSQASLSKLSDASKGIFESSINTQKRIAENNLEGGYKELDALRLSAQMALEKATYTSKQPSKETKTGLLLMIEKLESEKQSLRNDLLLLTLAFEKSLRQSARYAARADASILALCKKEQRELLDTISLQKHTFNSNVVNLLDN